MCTTNLRYDEKPPEQTTKTHHLQKQTMTKKTQSQIAIHNGKNGKLMAIIAEALPDFARGTKRKGAKY